MNITLKNIKKIWLTADAIHIETQSGRKARELFADYPRLRDATPKQREKYFTSEFGIHWSTLDEDLSFNGFFKPKKRPTEISALFSQVEEINVSAFARKIGIAQPLMADYISGRKIPGEKQKKKIVKGLHDIGRNLINTSL